MASLRVVKHLDVVEDIGSGLIAGWVDLATDSLSFQKLEEAFGHGVVMAIAPTAHAGNQIVSAQEVLPCMPSELTALIRVDGVSSFGCRRHNAISSALITNSVSMRCPMDQPITCLENRSMTALRYLRECVQ